MDRPYSVRAASLIGLLTVVASAAILGGCGSGHKSAAPASTVAGETTTVSVPRYNAAENARQDVTTGACVDGGAKGWSFSGTVTNSASKARGYSIAIDFITVPGDTVVDTKLVTVPSVQPHATAKWSTSGAAPGTKNLTCVVRQTLST